MKFNSVKLISLVWAVITLLVLLALLMLDIGQQRHALQLESRVVYEFAHERAVIDEVILHNFVELIELDHDNMAAIGLYSRELMEHHPHIQRLLLYQRVAPDQLVSHEQQMREAGFAEYRVRKSDINAAALVPSTRPRSVYYPVVFTQPMDASGLRLLGVDGYSVLANQNALVQTSLYPSVFSTEPYPQEDEQMGFLLLHAVDPAFTDSRQGALVAALVLGAAELLPPLAHIEPGLTIGLFDQEGNELVRRESRPSGGGWLLPRLSDRRSFDRFGQSSELLVEKQLLWHHMNWPVGLVVLLFSIIAWMVSAQGIRRREEAELEMLKLSSQQADEKDQLERRVRERTQELVSRNSELRHQVKENRNLIQKVLDIQETERRNIARELHDEMGQALTAIRTDARLLQLKEPDHSSVVYTAAAAIDSTALRIYGVTYGLMRALRPSALDDLGLVDALKQCVDSFNLQSQGITPHLQLSGALNELPESVCIQCYRIVQEGLNNCVKYAKADNLWLSVRLESDESNRLLIKIADDGVGFDPKIQNSGFGLIGMRERALAHEGHFDVCSTPGQGTRIEAELSVNELFSEALIDDPT